MKSSQLPVFLLFVTAVLVSGFFYLDRKLLQRLATSTGELWAYRSVILAIFLLQYAVPVSYRAAIPYRWDGWVNALSWAGYTLLGFCGMVLVIQLFFGLVEWLTQFGGMDVNTHKRLFFSTSVPRGILGLSVIGTGIGIYQARKGPDIIAIDIPIRDLPKEFDGYRIAQISDLHVGPTIGPSYVDQVVELTQKLQADAIVLTGDIVDGFTDQIAAGYDRLKGLSAKDGVFFVTGNHEYFWGAPDWVEKARTLGIKALMNEHQVIRRGSAQLVMAGVPDVMGERLAPGHAINYEKTFTGAPEGAPRILLSHNPHTFEDASKHGIALQLSGHTHAGQFYPFKFFAKIPYKHFDGLYSYDENGRHIYVNRGTGYWGPPIRFGVQSEITHITLRRHS